MSLVQATSEGTFIRMTRTGPYFWRSFGWRTRSLQLPPPSGRELYQRGLRRSVGGSTPLGTSRIGSPGFQGSALGIVRKSLSITWGVTGSPTKGPWTLSSCGLCLCASTRAAASWTVMCSSGGGTSTPAPSARLDRLFCADTSDVPTIITASVNNKSRRP